MKASSCCTRNVVGVQSQIHQDVVRVVSLRPQMAGRREDLRAGACQSSRGSPRKSKSDAWIQVRIDGKSKGAQPEKMETLHLSVNGCAQCIKGRRTARARTLLKGRRRFIHTKSRPFPQRPKDRVCDFTALLLSLENDVTGRVHQRFLPQAECTSGTQRCG